KIIFNSIGQLQRFRDKAASMPRGLRINPGVSSSQFDLADPARPFSRLGEWDADRIGSVVDEVDGFMIHNNCENGDLGLFEKLLAETEERFGRFFGRVNWISLGGGIHFTGPDYPVDEFCRILRKFADRHRVQVYLEPGE